MPRPRPRGSRTGTLLVLVGAAAVLGGTFTAGLYTGRSWAPRHDAAARAAERDPRRVEKKPEIPALTFYQELTAPLTAPPPPPKPGKPGKPLELTRSIPRAEANPARPEATVAPSGTAAAAAAPPRVGAFSIQVGAYKSREPAEALRATLAAAGHDAHVVESEAVGVARYRVRVGAYATREEARVAAERLRDERALATFVTAR